MEPPPVTLGGGRVLRWTPIDARHRPTGATRHFVAEVLRGPAAALAIVLDGGDRSYYLFGCDEHWQTHTDTWHATIEDAVRQAELEYEGSSATWTKVADA